MKEVIIIGAGLSGLTAGYYLRHYNKDILIIEGSQEIGGRIKTSYTPTGAALEMGATWVFDDPNLKELIEDLNLKIYKQYNEGIGLYEIDVNDSPQEFNVNQSMGGAVYHKLTGGTFQIIKSLAEKIGETNILKNTIVRKIEDHRNFLRVYTSEDNYFDAKNVVITVPPRLLATSITFTPSITSLNNALREKTHTWMGDSVKFSAEFKTPFWRKKNLAGLAISYGGLVREVQDHVNADATTFSLVGFLNLNQEQLEWSLEKRMEYVVNDLVRLFGKEAKEILNYQDYIWGNNELITPKKIVNSGLYSHQNNGNELLSIPEMNNKLFFAGAETSATNPGVMEGAVKSGKKVVQLLLSKKV